MPLLKLNYAIVSSSEGFTMKCIKIIALFFLSLVFTTLPITAFTLADVVEEQRSSYSLGFLNNSIQITPAPNKPLYPEAIADPYGASSALSMITMKDADSIPLTIRTIHDGNYEDLYFREQNIERNAYLQLRSAVNLALMRISWNGWGILPEIRTELSIQGGLNTVFNNFGAQDTMGFDGFYFLGINAQVSDLLSLRFGLHHFSGHYGDETLSSLYERNTTYAPGGANPAGLVEYVRDNSFLAGISLGNRVLRLYAEAELPRNAAWIRPAVHIPTNTLTPGSETQLLQDRVSGQEGISLDELPEEYKAWRLQTGFEIRLPIAEFGSLFSAIDTQFHQDGQTLHVPGGYDPQNPWEMEYTIGAGLELNQQFLGRNIRIGTFYHSGRFPLLNFFYQRCRYVSVGLGISG